MSISRERIVELDKRHVWHPYTEMGAYVAGTDPLVIERAEGSVLYDVDGRSYLDANASWWVALLGHRHPRLLNVLREQSETLCHVALAGITHAPAARLAAALSEVAPPGLEHVFFSDDGSTAVEVALKQCLQFWQNHGRPEKRRFVALDGAFHGDTLGATGVGGVEAFRSPFAGAVAEARKLAVPDDADDAAFERAWAAARRLFADEGDTIAAVVMEPVVQGAAGMRIYPAAFVSALRALCDEHDVLLVFDEVFTGYGRTGPMWAGEHAGVAPDLLCIAKGFTAGILPMAATLSTARVFDAFKGAPERAFLHGHTYCGHPLGAAIALEVLAIYREERILERAAPKAVRIREVFAALGERRDVLRSRSLGMIGALDLAGGSGYHATRGWAVYAEALARGVYLRPLGNTVYVTPPLTIGDEQLERLLETVAQSVAAVG